MRNLSERLADGVFISAVTAIMLVGIMIWLQPASEETEDNFSVTIDCRAIIMKPDEFPSEIVSLCREKVRFIKDTSLTTV